MRLVERTGFMPFVIYRLALGGGLIAWMALS
jgi:undecaprenyl pyrophosphate phosphatase UppP